MTTLKLIVFDPEKISLKSSVYVNYPFYIFWQTDMLNDSLFLDIEILIKFRKVVYRSTEIPSESIFFFNFPLCDGTHATVFVIGIDRCKPNFPNHLDAVIIWNISISINHSLRCLMYWNNHLFCQCFSRFCKLPPGLCTLSILGLFLLATRVPNEDPGDPHSPGFLLIFLPHSPGKKSRVPQFPKYLRKP